MNISRRLCSSKSEPLNIYKRWSDSARCESLLRGKLSKYCCNHSFVFRCGKFFSFMSCVVTSLRRVSVFLMLHPFAPRTVWRSKWRNMLRFVVSKAKPFLERRERCERNDCGTRRKLLTFAVRLLMKPFGKSKHRWTGVSRVQCDIKITFRHYVSQRRSFSW